MFGIPHEYTRSMDEFGKLSVNFPAKNRLDFFRLTCALCVLCVSNVVLINITSKLTVVKLNCQFVVTCNLKCTALFLVNVLNREKEDVVIIEDVKILSRRWRPLVLAKGCASSVATLPFNFRDTYSIVRFRRKILTKHFVCCCQSRK